MGAKKDFRKLLLRLSREPAVRAAIEEIRAFSGRSSDGKDRFHALPESLWPTMVIAARFFGKRRAQKFADFIDIATFLISLSLLLKENVFDRPEVREFVARRWRESNAFVSRALHQAREFVVSRLPRR